MPLDALREQESIAVRTLSDTLNDIARWFAEAGGHALIEPQFPLRDFTVSLHRSRHFEADCGNQWLRQRTVGLLSDRP